jgi:hypothetical protein
MILRNGLPKNLPLNNPRTVISVGLFVFILIAALLIYFRFETAQNLDTRTRDLEADIDEIKKSYENLNQNLEEELFQDHLKLRENINQRERLFRALTRFIPITRLSAERLTATAPLSLM